MTTSFNSESAEAERLTLLTLHISASSFNTASVSLKSPSIASGA
jgi:hypothetical protein